MVMRPKQGQRKKLRHGSKLARSPSPTLPPPLPSLPPVRDEEWVPLICTEECLNRLVWEGVLPDKALSAWHSAAREEFPTLEMTQVVVFE
jgi:hypothetical protein